MSIPTSTTMPVAGPGRAGRAPDGSIRLVFPLQGPVHTDRTLWLTLSWDEAQQLIRELSAIQRLPTDTSAEEVPTDG